MSIQTLHDDNLVIIFNISAELNPPAPYEASRGLGWISLSHVSRRWRFLLLDQAMLWGRVLCEFLSRDAFRTCLHRARTAQLSLKVDRDWVQRCSSIEELASLIPRARRIWAADAQTRVSMLSLEGLTLPLLEELTAVKCHGMNQSLIAPALRRLTIQAIPFSVSAPQLRTLSVIIATWTPGTHCLPDLVAAFSRLEELTINFVERDRCQLQLNEVDDETASRNNRDRLSEILTNLEHGTIAPKEMTCLSLFRVNNCDDLFIKALWLSLTIPRSATVSVAHASDAVWRLATAEPMQTYLSYPDYDTLRVTTSADSREQCCSISAGESDATGSCNVTLTSSSASYVLSASSLDPIFTNVRTLRLVNNQEPLAPGEGVRSTSAANTTPFNPTFGGFLSVQRIELSGPGVVALLAMLSLYNFPQLKTVDFDGSAQSYYDRNAVRDLARILKARVSLPGNTKLDRITIRGWFPHAERSILGRETLDLGLQRLANAVLDERVVR